AAGLPAADVWGLRPGRDAVEPDVRVEGGAGREGGGAVRAGAAGGGGGALPGDRQEGPAAQRRDAGHQGRAGHLPRLGRRRIAGLRAGAGAADGPALLPLLTAAVDSRAPPVSNEVGGVGWSITNSFWTATCTGRCRRGACTSKKPTRSTRRSKKSPKSS